ncbi:hypothetical protein ANN_27534 [Periplaneta americana]|uniref:Uncharacterized protein n=1 Tax=Periplaneta americana TaxID=6978 RepID=A0ABQ8RW06_PERAM|nr:hypothetical protein ANN_27534 [Periplaneta americana]
MTFQGRLQVKRDAVITRGPDVQSVLKWHSFATSHGKGAVDGVGGTIKRGVGTIVNVRRELVTGYESFATVAKQVCPSIKTVVISKEEIEMVSEKNKLSSLWEKVNAVPATQTLHCIIPSGESKIVGKKFSFSTEDELYITVKDCKQSGKNTPYSNNDNPNLKCMSPGEFTLVKFATKSRILYYVGQVLEIDEKGDMIKLNFLRRNCSSLNLFMYPEKENIWG